MNISVQTQRREVEKKMQYSWVCQIAISFSVARCNSVGVDNHSILCHDFFTILYKYRVGMMHYLIKDDFTIYFWIFHSMISIIHICKPAQDTAKRFGSYKAPSCRFSLSRTHCKFKTSHFSRGWFINSEPVYTKCWSIGFRAVEASSLIQSREEIEKLLDILLLLCKNNSLLSCSGSFIFALNRLRSVAFLVIIIYIALVDK